jgi:hypothetical protein
MLGYGFEGRPDEARFGPISVSDLLRFKDNCCWTLGGNTGGGVEVYGDCLEGRARPVEEVEGVKRP